MDLSPIKFILIELIDSNGKGRPEGILKFETSNLANRGSTTYQFMKIRDIDTNVLILDVLAVH